MGLFKSKDERRIEREMKIRGGMRSIERSIRQQEKFADDFIKNAQHARKIGDEGQYQFIRSALKKTATVKKMLERQLLSIRNAMLIQQQAQASQQFAESMALMAKEIGHTFGELDLTKTQADWERAVSQAGSIEERMDIFLDSMEQSATSASSATSSKQDLVTDEEIDRMISADVLASEKTELGKLDQLESEIAKELGNKQAEGLNSLFKSRRITRLTNAFSKRIENHMHAVALHYLHYNFIRVHQTIKTTPAVAAGLTDKQWTMVDFVQLLEQEERLLGGRITDYKPAASKKRSNRSYLGN